MKKKYLNKYVYAAVFAIGLFYNPIANANYSVSEKQNICKKLKTNSEIQLGQIFQISKTGKIPNGKTFGCIIGWPDMRGNSGLTQLLSVLWKGKTFENTTDTLTNNILGLGLIQAQVYNGASVFDGQPAIILDYSQQMKPFSMVRDEIREVKDGIYIGRAYIQTSSGNILAAHFALIQ